MTNVVLYTSHRRFAVAEDWVSEIHANDEYTYGEALATLVIWYRDTTKVVRQAIDTRCSGLFVWRHVQVEVRQ